MIGLTRFRVSILLIVTMIALVSAHLPQKLNSHHSKGENSKPAKSTSSSTSTSTSFSSSSFEELVLNSSYVHLEHRWTVADYDWSVIGNRTEWITSKQFIPKNNQICGIKVYNNITYVTVPRWAPGVPSTLNKVVTNELGLSILQPYPSFKANSIDQANSIKYCQDIEIDPLGRMWILDSGLMNNWVGNMTWNQPKLIVMDISTEKVLYSYLFPPSVIPPYQVFLNDLVLDLVHGFVYMSNSMGNGGIVVLDLNTSTSRMFVSPQTGPGTGPNDNKYNVTCLHADGNFYSESTYGCGFWTQDGSFPSDGIALSSDGNTVYFSPLSGFNLYAVPTAALRNFSFSNSQIQQVVRLVGIKNGQSDGLAMSSIDTLFYGNIGGSGIQFWNSSLVNMTNSNQHWLVRQPQLMQWIDTMGFDNHGYLYFTSNRLQLMPTFYQFFNVINFRIWKVYVGQGSYMLPMVPMVNGTHLNSDCDQKQFWKCKRQ